MSEQERVVKALRELADKVETDGISDATFRTRLEVIEVPTKTGWREHRPGPRTRIVLNWAWANTAPADTEAGEVSKAVGEGHCADCLVKEKRLAELKAENERLQGLVDLDHTYGHLYLVAMRKLKEHSEELYWELFDTVLAHFDALLKKNND